MTENNAIRRGKETKYKGGGEGNLKGGMKAKDTMLQHVILCVPPDKGILRPAN